MSGSARIAGAFSIAIAASAVWSHAALAQSNNDIIGLWKFNGGVVAVTKNDRTKAFTGTVVKATTGGACPHPVGENMWTDVRLAGNLNYFGRHVWFLTNPCRPAPSTGTTAWKIFSDINGKRFLRGCYANWANSSFQPQIDQTGFADTGPGGSCIDSYAAPQKRSTFRQIAKFPKVACVRSSLKLRFSDPPTDALARIRVTAGGARHTLDRARMASGVSLRLGPGQSRLAVKVVASTLLGKKISGARTFKACA